MATIHITEIQKILNEKGQKDALPYNTSGDGYFLEIKFDELGQTSIRHVDEEFKNKVITAECPYGSVVIQFDEYGMLKSIDLS